MKKNYSKAKVGKQLTRSELKQLAVDTSVFMKDGDKIRTCIISMDTDNCKCVKAIYPWEWEYVHKISQLDLSVTPIYVVDTPARVSIIEHVLNEYDGSIVEINHLAIVDSFQEALDYVDESYTYCKERDVEIQLLEEKIPCPN